MSNSRRPKPVKVQLPKLAPGQVYGVRAAAFLDRTLVGPGELVAGQDTLAEALDEEVGARRRSPIIHTQHRGREALTAYLGITEGDVVREIVEALTDNPRGLLLVAWAVVDPEVPGT